MCVVSGAALGRPSQETIRDRIGSGEVDRLITADGAGKLVKVYGADVLLHGASIEYICAEVLVNLEVCLGQWVIVGWCGLDLEIRKSLISRHGGGGGAVDGGDRGSTEGCTQGRRTSRGSRSRPYESTRSMGATDARQSRQHGGRGLGEGGCVDAAGT